jgi:hypothetical protein
MPPVYMKINELIIIVIYSTYIQKFLLLTERFHNYSPMLHMIGISKLSPDGVIGISFSRGDFIYPISPYDGAEDTLYAQWKPRDGFGVCDTMYMVTGQVFGLHENNTVTDAVYDSSVSGVKPALAYPDGGLLLCVSGSKRPATATISYALYLYKCDGSYDPGNDFAGYPLDPYDPDYPDNPYSAPEGSLIGTENNDGLTGQCKVLLKNKYGNDWAKGLVTVENITMLWKDPRVNNDPDAPPYDYTDNEGFVFTSVNGVRYFISGKVAYYYGMKYQYEYL